MSKDLYRQESDNNRQVALLVQKYQAQLRGFINKRVPSPEDAEDILQNVFYQLARVDFEANPIEQVSAWLYSVARHQIIDLGRKQREEEMPYVADRDDDSFIGELTLMLLDEDASPETDMVKSLIWEELDAALAELPEEQRTVFQLTELEGFTFKDIADSTGIPINTLLSRKRYAVLHLRKRLAQLYEDLLTK